MVWGTAPYHRLNSKIGPTNRIAIEYQAETYSTAMRLSIYVVSMTYGMVARRALIP